MAAAPSKDLRSASGPLTDAAGAPMAWVGGRLLTGLRDITDDLSALDSRGTWAVVITFEGAVVCARFDSVRAVPLPSSRARWYGPPHDGWTTSLSEQAYSAAVEDVRRRIAQGDVYQVNICRMLSAPLPADADALALADILSRGNPAPYAAVICLADTWVVSASPELFLRRRGRWVESAPIKGTGATPADLRPKDTAENVMIVDLVRNDLGRVAETGTVTVPSLLAVERHPGLVHLVSTVRARLHPDVGWPELLAATFPPGSISGAPKKSALRVIAELEPVPRGPYCGALGWIDADAGSGALAVGIRTFFASGGRLHFGTGAGITWGSDPAQEWAETELKAARLVGLASAAS